jgi:hypothetical protein
MRDQEQRAFGDKAPFDQYLSAFLSAGMSVRGAFRVEQDRQRNDALKTWKKDWESKLTQAQVGVYEFMKEDRDREVHRLVLIEASKKKRSRSAPAVPIATSPGLWNQWDRQVF